MSSFQSEDGAKLSYQVSGDGSPVVFVNGLGSLKESWAQTTDSLARFAKVIGYDFRNQGTEINGHGRDYDMFRHVEDLRLLLDHLGVEKVRGVGISTGARILMDFASAHPDRVNSLVLMGAGNLEFGERYQMIFRTWLHALESSPSDDLGPYSEVFATWIYSPAYLSASPDFVPNVARTLDKTMARAGTAENLRALIKSYGKEYAERKPRARASCPALFLQGEYDFLTPPAYLKGIERYFPHSILSVVEGAGHNIRVERREEFEKQMMHFFLQDEDF